MMFQGCASDIVKVFYSTASIYRKKRGRFINYNNSYNLFLLGFMSHQHCERYVVTIQLYWWRRPHKNYALRSLFQAQAGTGIEPDVS